MRCSIVTLICLVLNSTSGYSAVFPTSQTVNAYEVAFFPCEIPGMGLPLWVINETEYSSSNMLQDHAVNGSGLLVHAHPEYNNTIYECRFVTINTEVFPFISIDVTTSPGASLTIIGNITSPPICSCERSLPTKATYNIMSQVLTIGLNKSLTDDGLIRMLLCQNGTVEKYVKQNCSALDVVLQPQDFNDLVVIAFPPVCNACIPVLDYTTYMAVDFSHNGTVPSSVMQKLQVNGNCLESILFMNEQFHCSNLFLYISANGKSMDFSLTNDDSISLEYNDDRLQICFLSGDQLQEVIGDVKEVLIQESCTLYQNELCIDNQSIVGVSHVHIFGNKGMLTLCPDSNETDVQAGSVCSLMDITSSSTASNSMFTDAYTPALSTLGAMTMSIVSSTRENISSVPAKATSSATIFSLATPMPSSSTPSGPVPALIVTVIVLSCLIVLVSVVIFVVIVRYRLKPLR